MKKTTQLITSSLLVLGLGATSGALQANTLLADDFSSPPASGWYSSTTQANTINENGMLGLRSINQAQGRHLITYFDNTTLNVGETLNLSFTFRVSGTTGEAIEGVSSPDLFRFGLFNSNDGGQVNVNAHGVSGTGATPNGLDSGFDSYIGYSGTFNFNPSSNQLGLRKRGAIANQLLTSAQAYTSYTTGNSNLATNGNTSANSMILDAGYDYNVSFALTMVSENQLDMVMNISGTDTNGDDFSYYISVTETSDIISNFDSFAFSVNNTGVDFYLTEIDINVIPEPKTYALGFGLLALGFAYFRRLRNR